MQKQTHILVVDDNEMNRDVLEGLIEALGHTAVLAESGKEALELIGQSPQPDLVLLDILMPEMDGYEVLRTIKNDKNLRTIPVIMVSVVDEMDSLVKCIEAGAEDYLIKPFNTILLKARINASLEKKHHYDQEQKFNYWLAESYQKLQKAEETRDALFQMIIHDMNNPLTAVLGGVAFMKLNPDNDTMGEHCLATLDTINIGAQQIHALVKGILDISEMEQGTIPVTVDSVDIAALVHDVQQQFREEVENKNVQMSVQVSESKLDCRTDKALLLRIMQNLVANSLKYGISNPQPEIIITVKHVDTSVQVCVQDNGKGVSDENIEHIFTKFYQADHKVKGLGLGLAFCKLATEALGGTLTAENNPDMGILFCLTLPTESVEIQ